MSRFRLITFDVTGTILKFRLPIGEQYAQIGSRFGIAADPSRLSSSYRIQWERLNAAHPNYGAKTGISWEQWWDEIVRGTFSGAGVYMDKGLLRSVTSDLRSAYMTPVCWDYCEGAKQLLERLRKNQVPLGIISNFDDSLETILVNMGIRDYFKFVVSSYGAGCQKPDPRIFELALKLNGCNVKPIEAVHIGDTYEFDYVGAIRAGWNAYIVHMIGDKTFQNLKPGVAFETLSDLEGQLL